MLAGFVGSGAKPAKKKKPLAPPQPLVHQYRVRCDVKLPDGPAAPRFPGEEHTRKVSDGHRGCLEACEREAIGRAKARGQLSECLGVAYRGLFGPGADGGWEGEGECRFWCGDVLEHELLPVHALPGAGEEEGRWQMFYM